MADRFATVPIPSDMVDRAVESALRNVIAEGIDPKDPRIPGAVARIRAGLDQWRLVVGSGELVDGLGEVLGP